MKRRKTVIQTVAIPLVVWAFQQLLAGHLYRGGVAVTIAIGLFYAYEHYNVRQLPTDAEDLQGLSETIGTELREQAGDFRRRV